MRPLTLDDLLPLSDFASQRRALFAAHRRYLDRYRRSRVGPSLTLLFENRQTLWFHVQELLRVARLAEPALVQEELNLYNRLLPRRDRLQAALLIEVKDETRLADELAFWRQLPVDALKLRIGERTYPGQLVTCRPEDRCIGAAHWVQFALDRDGRRALATHLPAYVEVTDPAYPHSSPPLSEDVKQSLLDDLAMSDRD